ncbi:hypothetical protein MHSWG343_05590 [Candidatus Mycoplasma haematohominis]|uniref:Uncharacterized protein n=1 Tax=Candidatus Mycoplasma haematohominis TaxID=1494318 RepID=A0A478FQF7_9MOLU|nr:hypothetical protein MHSWG343_05590 [Candidatus Mycoplasma haemohominis]
MNGNALKDECKKAYATTKGDVKSTKETNKYLESEVWRYCSSLETKPKTISEAKETTYNSVSGSFGNKKKQELISVKGNDLFWKLRNQEFFGGGIYGSSKAGTIDATKDSLFKNFLDNG